MPQELDIKQKVLIQLSAYIKSTFFQNMVMFYIKLKGMMHTITCWQIVCPYTHPSGGVKMYLFLFNSSSVEHYASLTLCTP